MKVAFDIDASEDNLPLAVLTAIRARKSAEAHPNVFSTIFANSDIELKTLRRHRQDRL